MASEEKKLLQDLQEDPNSRDMYGDVINEKEVVRFYLNNNKFKEALKYSLDQDSKRHRYPILFARAYEQNGEFGMALKCFAEQISIKHDHREALEGINRLSGFYGAKPPEFDSFRKIKQCLPAYKFRNMFDIGANVGQTVKRFLQFADDNIQIYSFEPAPDSFAILEKEYRHISNVHLFQLGISNISSSFQMLCNGASTMNRIVDGSTEEKSLGLTQEIECVSLEQFCVENVINEISYLKIDTEGHEIEGIDGFGKMAANIDFIECEVSANQYNKYHTSYQKIYDKLSAYGFYLFHIQEQTNEWTGGGYPVLRRFNAIFINKNVVGDMKGVLASIK